MNRVFLTSALCLWVVCALVVIVYTFASPREFVLHILMSKEAASGNPFSQLPSGFLSAAADQSATPFSSANSSTASTSVDLSSVDTSASLNSSATTTYLYKVMVNIDPCTFNRLGSAGWHIFQMGGNISYDGGYDENCKKSGIYPNMDWAFFELPIIPPGN